MADNESLLAAYTYLVEKVEAARADRALIVELQRVPTLRVEETVDRRQLSLSTSDSSVRRIIKEDLDTKTSRAPTAKEMIAETVEVLKARLIEVPAIARRLESLLRYNAESIVWLPDARETEVPARQATFSASDFRVSEEEERQIANALALLEELLAEP